MRAALLQSIYIKLMPSKLLLGLLGIVSITSCAIILSLAIPLYIKLVIIALVLASSAYFILRDALLLLPWSWQSLEVNSKGELTITNKLGQQFQPTLAPSSFIHAACTILNFKRKGLKPALLPVILMTSVDNVNDLRRLRVWLRWFKHDKQAYQDDLVADLAL